jgi:hypothetical protein
MLKQVRAEYAKLQQVLFLWAEFSPCNAQVESSGALKRQRSSINIASGQNSGLFPAYLRCACLDIVRS